MQDLKTILQKHQQEYNKVVDFDSTTEKLCQLDFTVASTILSEDDITDTEKFTAYINDTLKNTGSKYGIGGYGENRMLYRRSKLFDGNEPRTVHLGIDVWGKAGSKVYAPLGGIVHSFAFNNNFGDYGATVILQHQLETKVFHTLYGHLSLKDLDKLKEGKFIIRGEVIGHFGEREENGDWPPHLHLQIIEDMRIKRGDYPGVCTLSEKEKYLANCPDADLVLNMVKYIRE